MLQRYLKEVAAAAGGVKDGKAAQLATERLKRVHGSLVVSGAGVGGDRGLNGLPIVAKRLDDSGNDEPLDVFSRRIMRSEAVALAVIERALQKRSERRCG
jgi:hypothetical protein